MTEPKKNTRFAILSKASDENILNSKENVNSNPEQTTSLETNENKDQNTPDSKGLKFNQPSAKLSKKEKKRKDDQIKDRATINVSEATRTRLKIFCATHKQVLQNWADEVLWKAMDRHEKALREAKEKKE